MTRRVLSPWLALACCIAALRRCSIVRMGIALDAFQVEMAHSGGMSLEFFKNSQRRLLEDAVEDVVERIHRNAGNIMADAADVEYLETKVALVERPLIRFRFRFRIDVAFHSQIAFRVRCPTVIALNYQETSR